MYAYDIGLLWNWEYDRDFVALLEHHCHLRELALLQVTPDNFMTVWRALVRGEMMFQVLLDRASDMDIRFLPIAFWARDVAGYRLNPYEKAMATWDKATLHTKLEAAGLTAPLTTILPAHEDQPLLPEMDLRRFGSAWVMKPAHGGGGLGVVTGLQSFAEVLAARQEFPADHYLLQAQIVPRQCDDYRAWFRVLYCLDAIYPCWWNQHPHVYAPVTPREIERYALQPLFELTRAIARLCELDIFSTEIALTAQGEFVVVDYVNDQIDLRLRSQAADGVPDEIVQAIAARIAEWVAIQSVS